VAELRLPPSLTPEERQERIDAVIEVRAHTLVNLCSVLHHCHLAQVRHVLKVECGHPISYYHRVLCGCMSAGHGSGACQAHLDWQPNEEGHQW
jgi:hypothetical protein